MIAWSTVEVAIANWIRTATGITTIWARQDSPRPDGQYVALNFTSVERIGQDWVDVDDNPTPGAGTEIIHTVRGPRRCVLSAQCFGGPGTGATSPVALLEQAISAVRLPSVQAALNTAGVGVASFSPVLAVDGILNNTEFEPRASTTVRLFLTSEVAEADTYIQSVEIEHVDESNTFTVTS